MLVGNFPVHIPVTVATPTIVTLLVLIPTIFANIGSRWLGSLYWTKEFIFKSLLGKLTFVVVTVLIPESIGEIFADPTWNKFDCKISDVKVFADPTIP